MSGSDYMADQSQPPAPHQSYVTQAQLEKIAQKISQSLQQQLSTFTSKLLGRFSQSQQATSVIPPPYEDKRSGCHPPSGAQQIVLPRTPHAAAKQWRDRVEHATPRLHRHIGRLAPRNHLKIEDHGLEIKDLKIFL
ncbi:uncharacterized protein LOC109835370 [Asparagus officinalis]|uniref:uncharacterized protein LOC109835370 n=1 Tax=Asparagus officinalis TaxID=4686 RepID=UPI00098E4277|nr:uncharacterized protein LOC109835370 [Asparagus officinalis]